jgi:hypothetical protein
MVARDEQDVGLALIGIGSAFGIFGSMNISPLDVANFAGDPVKLNMMYTGMGISLAIILASAAGIAMYYKKRGYAAAAFTASTGLFMWAWYDKMIKELTL